jgi:hypothetical protein
MHHRGTETTEKQDIYRTELEIGESRLGITMLQILTDWLHSRTISNL